MESILKIITELKTEYPEILTKITDKCILDNFDELECYMLELCGSSTCKIEELKIVLQLIDNCNIEYEETEKTALMLACSSNHLSYEKTEELLKYDVDISDIDKIGNTAMDYAIINKNIKVAKLLINYTNSKLKKLEELEDKNEELEDKNEELEDKNKELKDKNKELEDKNKELEDKNKELNELKSNTINILESFSDKRKKDEYVYVYVSESESNKYKLLIEKYFNEGNQFDNIQYNIFKEIENGKKEYKFKINTNYFYNNTNETEREISLKNFIAKMYEIGKLDKSIVMSHCDCKDYKEIDVTLSF